MLDVANEILYSAVKNVNCMLLEKSRRVLTKKKKAADAIRKSFRIEAELFLFKP